jgi:hypothetical protein
MQDEQGEQLYRAAAEQTVELGNKLAESDPDADLWDIADGILAGAVQYWLYSRQPCDDPRCEDCAAIRTALSRMAELQQLVDQTANESEYYHSPHDLNAGRA